MFPLSGSQSESTLAKDRTPVVLCFCTITALVECHPGSTCAAGKQVPTLSQLPTSNQPTTVKSSMQVRFYAVNREKGRTVVRNGLGG